MENSKIKRVLIMAAGTGGHIFPALAIARLLREQEIEVAWLGTESGMECSILATEGIPLYIIPMQGFSGKGFKNIGVRIWKAFCAFIQSLKIIHDYNPQVVLGMGGYVSVPGGLAAWLLRKKLIIHEQNAALGFANFLLSHLTATVLLGFEKTINSKGNIVKGRYVGNPVRKEILAIDAPELRFKNRGFPIRLLIFAGSQGSQTFNKIVPEALFMLSSNIAIEVWHQTGGSDSGLVAEQYKKANITAKVEPFITDMVKAYAWADCVIARSGALTVSEISAVGLDAIFVPYPYHADEQQKHNAQMLVDAQAAFSVDQREWSPKLLADLLHSLCVDRKKLYEMALRGYALRNDNAAEEIKSQISVMIQ